MRPFFTILLGYALLTFPLHAGKRWIPWKTAVAAGDTEYVTTWSGGSLSDSAGNERGFKFTVGGSPITVTELGIWGNASHYSSSMTVYLRSSGGTDLGNVSITWGTAGQWYWGTLSSPVTLSASTTYFIMTASLSFNHRHRNFVPTVTGAATYNNGAEAQPPVDSGFSVTEAALNFKYHF